MKQKKVVTYVRCEGDGRQNNGCGLLVNEDCASIFVKKPTAVCYACEYAPEGQKAARRRMLAEGWYAAESVEAARRLAGL